MCFGHRFPSLGDNSKYENPGESSQEKAIHRVLLAAPRPLDPSNDLFPVNESPGLDLARHGAASMLAIVVAVAAAD